jgi:hypothetical protein
MKGYADERNGIPTKVMAKIPAPDGMIKHFSSPAAHALVRPLYLLRLDPAAKLSRHLLVLELFYKLFHKSKGHSGP